MLNLRGEGRSSFQQPRGRLLDDIGDPRDRLGGEGLVAGHDGVADRGEVLDVLARELRAKDDVLELCAVGDLKVLRGWLAWRCSASGEGVGKLTPWSSRRSDSNRAILVL